MTRYISALAMMAMLAMPAFSALPVTPTTDQAPLLKSNDPKVARNKKNAYDFFRIVLRARHLDQADKYMREDYIQHNPNADTGMAGFKAYFTKLGGPTKVLPNLPDLIAIQGEGDYVTLSFVREYDDPQHPGQKYTTTWFDMLRFDNEGKLAEHWDNALKPTPGPTTKK